MPPSSSDGTADSLVLPGTGSIPLSGPTALALSSSQSAPRVLPAPSPIPMLATNCFVPVSNRERSLPYTRFNSLPSQYWSRYLYLDRLLCEEGNVCAFCLFHNQFEVCPFPLAVRPAESEGDMCAGRQMF